ncbi:MAG: hypothetical protein IT162_12965 [Bryobacterales bacterium]|nr:hypothetical protein [Bryobacterales bacterium]
MPTETGLHVRFQRPGGAVRRVVQFSKSTGVVFDEHADASPLICAFGLHAVLPADALKRVQGLRGWKEGTFKLEVHRAPDDDGLLFTGFGGDQANLPEGVYDFTVQVESMRYQGDAQRLVLRKGKVTEMVLEEKPDRRQVKLIEPFDKLTAALAQEVRSQLDGTDAMSWLRSSRPRPARRACLLNILAKLRTPAPDTKKPLTPLAEFVYFADVDRVYLAAQGALVDRLRTLTAAGLWASEGEPKAPIHKRLLDSMTRVGVTAADAKKYKLESWREGGKNSMQLCVAIPPATLASDRVYVDADIDLGNPLWDLEGLIIHIGELVDPSRTDHLALRDKLAKTDAAEFLYYD